MKGKEGKLGKQLVGGGGCEKELNSLPPVSPPANGMERRPVGV